MPSHGVSKTGKLIDVFTIIDSAFGESADAFDNGW